MTDRKPIAAGKSSFEIIDEEAVFAQLQLKGGETVIDAGSGIGNYAVALATTAGSGSNIHAFDLWPEGIEQLRQRINTGGLRNLAAAVADVSRNIPMDDGAADVFLMVTVLHDLVEDGKGDGALREAARVLKPGGRLVIVEFNKEAGTPGPPLHIRLAPEELDSLVEPAGFAGLSRAKAGPYAYISIYRRESAGA
ncbi:MAG: methyltransferase domain-containing protein [Actinobacteria bacterium]|nr:methyltransferase domain-containing protein [Actinomycetota bacterium]